MLPGWQQNRDSGVFLVWSLLMLVSLIAIAVSDSIVALQLYPVVMSVGFLLLFLYSLAVPPSMVEKIARLNDSDLPDAGVRYTRNVTMVWSVFFLLNGAIAAFTVWMGDRALWALYNGLIAYLLMGALMIAEYWVRGKVRKTFENE